MTNSTNSNNVKRDNHMTAKNFKLFSKCMTLALDKAAKESKESNAAISKCVTLCAKYSTCKAFKRFDVKADSCKKCNFSVMSICSYVKNLESDKKALFVMLDEKAFAAKKAEKVERDKYNFTLSGNHSSLAAILENECLKMSEIKNRLGNTYYCCANKFPTIFAKSVNKYFYVIGSNAEKLSIEIDKKIADLKKEAAKLIEKEKAAKKAEAEKKKTDRAEADKKKKDDAAKKKAEKAAKKKKDAEKAEAKKAASDKKKAEKDAKSSDKKAA